MATATIQKQLRAVQGGPFSPGDTLTFQIPAGEGFADLTKSQIELRVTPTSAAAPAVHLPAGGWGLISSIIVRIEGLAEPLEQIRDVNRLAAAIKHWTRSTNEVPSRQLVQREAVTEKFQFLSRNLGSASTLATKKVFLDLDLLGIGKYKTFPLAATNGLVIELQLAPAASAFREYLIGGPMIPVAQPAGAAYESVTLDASARAFPGIDFARSADENHFDDDDHVAVLGTATNYDGDRAQMNRQTFSATTGGMQLHFTAGVGGVPTGNDFAVFRDIRIELDTSNPAAYFETTQDMTLAECPFYHGQRVVMYTRVSFAPPAVPTNYEASEVVLAAITQSGTKVRCTFATPLAAGARDALAFVRGNPVTDLSYSVTEPRLNLQHLTPSAAMLDSTKEAVGRGLILPLMVAMSHSETFPAGATQMSHVIPTPSYMTSALAAITIPTLSGQTAYDYNVAGWRDYYTQMRWVVDGQSDPLQPVPLQYAWPTIWDSEAIRTFAQLNEAARELGTGGGMFPQMQRIVKNHSHFMFPKPFNSAGLPRSIAGLRVALEVSASSATGALTTPSNVGVKAATSAGLTFTTFIYHVRRLKISSNGITLE